MRRIAVALAVLLLAAGASPVLAGGGTPKLGNIDAGPHLAELSNDSPSLMTGSNTLTVQIRDLPADHTVLLALEGPNGARVAVPLTRVIVLGDLEDDHHSHDESGDDHSSTPPDAHTAPAGANVQPSTSDPHGGMTMSPMAADGHASMTGAAVAAHDGHGTPATPAPARPAPVADTHAAIQPADLHGAAMSRHGTKPTDDHAVSDAHGSDGHGIDTTQTPGQTSETYLARGTVSLPSTGSWNARLVIRDPAGEEVVGETPIIVTEGGPSTLYLGFTGSLIFGSMLFGLIQRRRTDRTLVAKKGRV